jgi:hypothetical protein
MSENRKKPLWPWIMALLIGLPVLYLASFGPACWLRARYEDKGTWDGPWAIADVIYRPVLAAWWYGQSETSAEMIEWYANFGSPSVDVQVVRRDGELAAQVWWRTK